MKPDGAADGLMARNRRVKRDGGGTSLKAESSYFDHLSCLQCGVNEPNVGMSRCDLSFLSRDVSQVNKTILSKAGSFRHYFRRIYVIESPQWLISVAGRCYVTKKSGQKQCEKQRQKKVKGRNSCTVE